MPAVIQSSFAKGEVTPGVYGRVDIAAYYIALRTAYNCIIHRFGGISNRPGTEIIGPVKDHAATAPLLIPFQQKTTDSYMLEFGDEYMRVIRNDAHVLEPDKNIAAMTNASPGVFTVNNHGYSDGNEVFLGTLASVPQLSGRRAIIDDATTHTFTLVDQITGVAIDTTNLDVFDPGNHVSNGDFAADEIWTKGTGWTISAGVASSDGSQAGASLLSQTAEVALVDGQSYSVQYVITRSAGTLTMVIGGTSGAARSAAGTYSETIVAGATQTIAASADADFIGTIDNIVIQPVSTNEIAKVFELVTPYAGDDITETNVLKFVQDADVMTLTHNLYAPRELSRTAHTTWACDEIVFGPDVSDAGGLAVTPNTTAAVTYLYRATALKRDTLEESLSISNGTTKNITSATAANPAVFTSASHGYLDGDEVKVGLIAGSGAWTTLNEKHFFIDSKTANTYQLRDQNGDLVNSAAFGAYPGSGVTLLAFVKITNGHATANNTISWTANSDAEAYRVYKFDNGSYGLIGTTTATSFLDDNIAPDLSKSYPRAKNPFNATGDYPNCAGFYQQRRAFAGTINDPDVRRFSQTGLHSNLNISSPLQDDDAITVRLASQDVQEVRWLVPDDDLLEFTSSTEWRTNSGSEQRFSLDTLASRPQTDWGVAFHLRPIKIGDTVLFAEDGAKRVRAFGYSFQNDKYRGPEVSLLAAHMLETYGIVDWAYQRKPEPRVFAVREDGALLTLTFDADQEVQAWTRCATKGKFKRVATLRNPSGSIGSEDGVYFVVERIVNGNTVKYIEKLSSRIFTDPRDCRFVDCGLSYDAPTAITDIDISSTVTITAAGHGLGDDDEVEFSDIAWVPEEDEVGTETQPDQLNNTRFLVIGATADTFMLTDLSGVPVTGTDFNAYVSGGKIRKCVNSFYGYDYLEGESLVGLVDGNVFRDLVVEGGRIVLPDNIKAARAHFGLPYTAEFETLDIEAGDGTIQGYTIAIDKVTLRFERSRGLLLGPNAANLLPIKMREDEDMGDPIALLTGDKEVELLNGWGTRGRILGRQLDPVPFTLLAAIPRFEIGG